MKYDVLVSNTLELSVFLKHKREVDFYEDFRLIVHVTNRVRWVGDVVLQLCGCVRKRVSMEVRLII